MFDSKKYRDELAQLDEELSKPDTVRDNKRMATVNREYMRLKELVDTISLFDTLNKSLQEAQDILNTNDDDELVFMAQGEVSDLQTRIEKLETEITLLIHPPDPDDSRNVIIEIRAGTGGDEAALFAHDLLTMYSRFAETQKWKVEISSMNKTELKGIKEVVAKIVGKDVYRLLKFESGVHRVQRIPETEKQGRIHTSTATVAVLPEVDDIEIEINPKDLRIDTFLSSGKGGQNVQKNETAARITHIPTGIVTASQSERSQMQNKEHAMNMLKAKLYQMEKDKRDEERASDRKGQVGTGSRSEKIRTYNFPQDRVTDHRITKSWHGMEGILAGDIEDILSTLFKESVSPSTTEKND